MGRELRTIFWPLLGFFVVLEAMTAAAIIWWPELLDNFGAMQRIASKLPVLGEMADAVESGGIGAYVAAQHFFKGCNALGVGAVALLAAGAVAGEVQRGTLELWLARPVTRARLLTERYVLGLAAIVLPVFATSATIPWLLTSVDESMDMAGLMRCSLHSSLFLASLYSLTFLWSCFGSHPMRIAMVVLFIAVFQFAIYLVKTVTDYSLFRLADVETFMRIIQSGKLDTGLVGGMVAVSVVCYVLSLAAFQRRVP